MLHHTPFRAHNHSSHNWILAASFFSAATNRGGLSESISIALYVMAVAGTQCPQCTRLVIGIDADAAHGISASAFFVLVGSFQANPWLIMLAASGLILAVIYITDNRAKNLLWSTQVTCGSGL